MIMWHLIMYRWWFNCLRFASSLVFSVPMLQTCTTIKKQFYNTNLITTLYTLVLTMILDIKIKIEEINKDCEVIMLTPTCRFDNRKAGNTVRELTNMLINLNVPIINNKNISWNHLGYKGLHLNGYRSL